MTAPQLRRMVTRHRRSGNVYRANREQRWLIAAACAVIVAWLVWGAVRLWW